MIAAGGQHSMAAQAQAVWTWGFNFTGQLGNGLFNQSPVPVQVSSLPAQAIAAIDGGGGFSAAIVNDFLYAWGDGRRGNLGYSSLPDECSCQYPLPRMLGQSLCDSRSLPAFVYPPARWAWSSVATGSWHTIAQRTGGSVRSFGQNFEGQLGDMSGQCSIIPVQVGDTCAPIIAEDPLRSQRFTDDCDGGGGNRDLFYEPGEQIEIDLGIRNDGGVEITGSPDVVGTLLGPAPAGVTYLDDTVIYLPTPMPPGTVAAPDAPFLIELDADIACPGRVDLTIEVVTDQGSWTFPVGFDLGPCVEQCSFDCLAALPAIVQLLMVNVAGQVEAGWTMEPAALAGYRLYSVATKELIPAANQASTPRTLECETLDPALLGCTGTTPVGSSVEVLFYQTVGVCAGGIEGPL